MSTVKNKQEGLNAAAAGYGDVRKYLNDDTVNVNGKNGAGETALHDACTNGRNGNVELLLDHGADIDALASENDTPLMCACDNGHASTTKLLLNRGCAVDAVDNELDTALHKGCNEGHTEGVKELLAHGADTTIKNRNGETPLDCAKDSENQTLIDLLMEHKKKRPQQALMNSTEDVKNDIVSEVVMSTLKADIFRPAA
jgi:ankyrin repeat protein